jgi:hypothetical protein
MGAPLGNYLGADFVEFARFLEGVFDGLQVVETRVETIEVPIAGTEVREERDVVDEDTGETYRIHAVYAEYDRRTRFIVGIAGATEVAFELPFLSGVTCVIAPPGDEELFGVTVELSETSGIALVVGAQLQLRFDRDLLMPVTRTETEGGAARYVPDETVERVEVTIGRIELRVTTEGVSLDAGAGFTIDRAVMIGDSGVVIEALRDVTLNLDGTGSRPDDAPADWRGLYIGSATVLIPDLMRGSFVVEGLGLGAGGLWGLVGYRAHPGLEFDEETRAFTGSDLAGEVLGFAGGVAAVELGFVQSVPAEGAIRGALLLPFFDAPIWLGISIVPDGFTIAVTGEDGGALARLEQPGLLAVELDSVNSELADDVFTFWLSGTLKPLIGGIDWPSLRLERLGINSLGEVDFNGGWIDLPESYSLDFHAFKIEIASVGFGSEGDAEPKRQWVGLSGGIRLIEGIPLSASVQGLKVSWLPPPAPDPQIKVSIEGIAVSLEIPNTLKIEGAVSYRELPRPPATLPASEAPPAEPEGSLYYGHVFTGSITIEITALNMAIAGELMIGELTAYHWEGTTRVDDQTFVAMFIMLSVELPTAIPLGATGAGLYGIKGLFGLNVAPNRQLDDEGEPESWYLWYKTDRGQSSGYSVTKVVKWAPRFDNFAFGAGLKLGTVYDDGFTINAGVLAAILIPGPVVMIEGRANLLKQRTGEGQGMEGALYALIVFDGIAETFQMNVDVNFALEDVITVAGGMEAFFDFNDNSRWFIHVGKKEPLDGSKRIRADILSIITAKAYFMIEPIGIQFGASVGVDLQYELGPIEIKLVIRLAFDLGIFWKEPQITGAIELYIELSLKIFGIGLGLLLQCALDASAPQPWWIHGIARAALSLPFPLPSFDVQVEFTWGETGPPAVVELLKGAAMVHPKLTGAAWALPSAATIAELPAPGEWPLVPVDSIPALSLGKPLTSISLAKDGEGRSSVFVEEETEGVFFGYQLRNVALKVKTPAGDWAQVTRFTSSAAQLRLRPDPYAAEPQIELWWYAPLDTYDPQSRRNYVDPCSDPVLPRHHCLDWSDVPLDTSYPPIFTRGGLTFTIQIGQAAVVKPVTPPGTDGRDRGLKIRGVQIRFPEPIWTVEVGHLVGAAPRLAAFRNGSPAAITSSSPQPGVRVVSAGGGLDTLHITSSNSLDQLQTSTVTSLCWTTMREAIGAMARGSPGNRTALRSDLVLEPNRSYVIEATGVRYERKQGETASVPTPQTMAWGFHTGGLPGTDYARDDVVTPAPCDFADGPLNQVASYVARTVPANGAPLFYRGYQVMVELTDPYAANMLAPVLSMRILDRNGKQIVPPPRFRLLTGGLPFLTSGLVAMLSADRERACRGTAVPWAAQILDRYIAAPLPDDTPAGRLVRVELVAGLPYGPETVFGFELATSRFRDALEHLASGLPRAAGAPVPARGVQAVRALGRTAAPPPLDWIGGVQDKLAAHARLRETLRAAYVFGPHDAGMSVDEARAAIAVAKAELDAQCAATYELLDRGGATYAGVHQLFVAAGLGHRPLPPASVETSAVDTDAGYFLLVESPEPLDWIRLTIRRVDGGDPLPVVWTSDGTRAFLFDSSPTRLFTGLPVSLRLSYHRGGASAPDLDPLTRPDEPSPVDEQVIWDCR